MEDGYISMDLPDQISDTHPHIKNKLIEGYRLMTPQQKFRCVSEMTKTIQQMAVARIRKKYGEISEHELRLRLASLWLDREIMIRVFHWDPKQEGY